MPESVLEAIKGLAGKIEGHAVAMNGRVDEILKRVGTAEEKIVALKEVEDAAKLERADMLARIPKRGPGGVPGAIIDALHDDIDPSKLEGKDLMREQCMTLMVALFSPRGATTGQVRFSAGQEKTVPIDGARLKALSIGIGQAGGFLIPRPVMAEIIQKGTLKSVMLANADIVDPADLTGSTNRENGDFTWSSTPELTQPTETSFLTLLNNLAWTLTNQAAFATISNKLLRYAPIDMANWLTDKAGRSFQAKADDWFFNGSGSGEPRGVRIGENVNSVAQAAATFDWDDLVELEASLGIAYRGDAMLFISDALRKLIAKLATTTGEPIFMGTGQMLKLGMTVDFKAQKGVLNLPGGSSYPYALLSDTALPKTLGGGANETEGWLGVPRQYRIWIGENMAMSQDSSGDNWRKGQTQLKFEWDGDGAMLLGEAWSKLTGVK